MPAAPSASPEPNLDDLQGKGRGPEEFSLAKPSRPRHSRKQPEGHIPRPPNAFILFRSSFVRSQIVSPDVETNPTTMSKIIGLTWKNLPADERRVWYARARQAVEEHRRRFPDYSFRPSQRRARGGGNGKAQKQTEARRKVRQRVVENPERCVKIAELLGEGKHGEALDGAMQEFDRERMPGIVTRFEPPVTATAYRRASSAPVRDTDPEPVVAQGRRSSSSSPSSRSREPVAPTVDQPVNFTLAQSPTVSTPLQTDPFDLSTFSFDSAMPVAFTDPAFDPLWFCDAQDSPTWSTPSPFSTNDDFKLSADQAPEHPPALDLDALINAEYAHEAHAPSELSSNATLVPIGGYSYNDAAYLAEIESQTEPALSQIEADFMNLMAQYSLEP
ncbi:hypothetical protein C8R45DRAFT_1212308 [Mycena sanguinolenta]|nr:hypothetical protein C8R45DRAFT_1212308 [Mycena sanguinolenta]